MNLGRNRLLRVITNHEGVTYLLRDLFSEILAAGAINGTLAIPGGTGTTAQKTRTVVDTESKLSINSTLTFASGKASASYTDPRMNYGAFARVLGRALLCEITLSATDKFIRFGWSTSTTDINSEAIVIFNNAGRLGAFPSATLGLTTASYSAGVTYRVAVILRNSGAYWMIKGGAFTNWKLFWVSAVGNTTSLYLSFFNHSSTAVIDNVRIQDLVTPYNVANGIASQFVASSSAGETISSDPNHIVEFTWTAITGEVLELDVRRSDVDNRWIVRCSQTGSTVKLIERFYGVEVERSSVAQTWTNGTSYRIVVTSDIETMTVVVDATTKITFLYALNNLYATGVKCSHLGTSLAAWPLFYGGNNYPTNRLTTTPKTYKCNKRLAPVLAKRVGKWDAFCTREVAIVIDEDGNMVRDGDGKLTSFYWGKPDLATAPAIGIAKSLDGITWDGRLDAPVLSKAGIGWYAGQVLAASVIKRTSDGLFMMACQGSNTIGVFTSSDGGLNWVEVGQKITLTDYTIAGTSIAVAGVPTCIKLSSGGYVMLFEGRVAGNAWRIFGATSSDFVGTWTPLNGGLALMTETGTGWESIGVANPHIIELTPGNFVVEYNGINAKWQVGLAFSTDLINWTRSTDNPIIHAGVDTDWDGYQTEACFLPKENFPDMIYYQGYSSGSEMQIGLAEFY